jgi:hypothetical protein
VSAFIFCIKNKIKKMKLKKYYGVLKSINLFFLICFLFLNIVIAKSEEGGVLVQEEKIEEKTEEIKEVEVKEKEESKEEEKIDEKEIVPKAEEKDSAEDIKKEEEDSQSSVNEETENMKQTEEKIESPMQIGDINLENKTEVEDLVQKNLVEEGAKSETEGTVKIESIPVMSVEAVGTTSAEKDESAGEKEILKLAEIVFSEIVIGDENDTKNEFIELYNFSDKEIDLKEFSLKRRAKNGPEESNLVSSGSFFGVIGPGEFFVIKNKKFEGANDADLVFSGKYYSIAEDNRIYLRDSEGNLIDAIGWGSCEKDCEENMISAELKEGQSLSRKNLESPKNFLASEFEITSIKTPGEKNVFSKSLKYADSIVFSEVLSNPEGADKNFEWIELENKGFAKANLDGWAIENGSGKRFKLADLELGVGEQKTVFIRNSSFVIRNTNEKLLLINPAEKIVSSISIPGSAPSGVSFGWSEERGWSWQKKQTPNGKNIANQLPIISIKKDKKVYRNTYAIFDASKSKDGDKDKLKFVWDFGDGHKSYLKETKHLYKKKGVYKASLSVKDGFEVVQKDFKVEVKSYPKRELRFTQLLPNPKGKDRGNELIEIENLSSKKVNLFNFYIANGHKSSSVVRHRISDDFILKPGEKRFISNEKVCSFSLLNTEGKVQLLYPDGKKAFEIEYEKEKINEGDIFQLENEDWEWLNVEIPATLAVKTIVEEESAIESDEELMRKINLILSKMTLNGELKICETYLKMQIENWKNSERTPKISLLKRISVNAKFSAQESF